MDLKKRFVQAQIDLGKMDSKLSQKEHSDLFALYLQGTIGDDNRGINTIYRYRARNDLDARIARMWRKLRGTKVDLAKSYFIARVREFNAKFGYKKGVHFSECNTVHHI